MAELKGQTTIYDHLKDEVEGEPTAARAMKILDQAQELGWTENPFVSLVVRLDRDDALPFFARWDLATSESGKRSWRFQGARASNGQPLAYNDIKTYLEDPAVIFPEPPDEECEAAQYDDPNQTVRGALGAVAPITAPDPAYVNGPPGKAGALPGLTEDRRSPVSPSRKAKPAPVDWGALLS